MLSVFSILLGVWAVVTMLSIAEGVFRDTLERVGRLGADRHRGCPRLERRRARRRIDDRRRPGYCAEYRERKRRVVPSLTSAAHDSAWIREP